MAKNKGSFYDSFLKGVENVSYTLAIAAAVFAGGAWSLSGYNSGRNPHQEKEAVVSYNDLNRSINSLHRSNFELIDVLDNGAYLSEDVEPVGKVIKAKASELEKKAESLSQDKDVVAHESWERENVENPTVYGAISAVGAVGCLLFGFVSGSEYRNRECD